MSWFTIDLWLLFIFYFKKIIFGYVANEQLPLVRVAQQENDARGMSLMRLTYFRA